MTGATVSMTAVDPSVIEGLDREACIDLWRRCFGLRSPKYASVQFMRRALAYEAQVAAHGGHSPTVRRALKAVLKQDQKATGKNGAAASGDRDGGADATGGNGGAVGKGGTGRSRGRGGRRRPSQTSLRPGTHLVREWNGRTYQVEVLEEGFLMDGKAYRSLSAIARKITGAHWSGPRFFALEAG